ncbi:MAG: hypothetical protein VB081_06455 [Christensenella sp.]|uniref:hypothetical protein n=1 Tax=Christensenella sp. TaxID=1935934 RepID=UPI002B1FA7B9|nr:hypothetical protein [Christensenella sp.]MEA5003123.1 hypothetical protein [Christensenella sp.]
MDILALVGAFGGGLIGAMLGAIPAFIMSGVIALIGGIATASGAPADLTIGFLAFGAFLGPHVAFAGGVAAAGYAGRTKRIKSGANIFLALNQLKSPAVLLVGGIFGMGGFLIHYLIGLIPFVALPDLPSITVVILAVITRLFFGSSGLTGECTGPDKKVWLLCGNDLLYDALLGGGVGIAVAFVGSALFGAGAGDAVLSIYPVICFSISAVTLLFTQMGFAVPATHHITFCAALATTLGISLFGLVGGALLGTLFGALAAVLGSIFCNLLNTRCDTHFDPPASTISALTITLGLIMMAAS